LCGEAEEDRGEGAADGEGAGLTPAIRSARITTAAIVSRRITKPTVPAVAGSRRR